MMQLQRISLHMQKEMQHIFQEQMDLQTMQQQQQLRQTLH